MRWCGWISTAILVRFEALVRYKNNDCTQAGSKSVPIGPPSFSNCGSGLRGAENRRRILPEKQDGREEIAVLWAWDSE